jgi:hypothetical protein
LTPAFPPNAVPPSDVWQIVAGRRVLIVAQHESRHHHQQHPDAGAVAVHQTQDQGEERRPCVQGVPAGKLPGLVVNLARQLAEAQPRSLAGRPSFDADSFRQGLQEALVQDPDLLALGRRQGVFNVHAGFVGVGVEQAVAVAPAAAYRVRIDFKPGGRINREVVDATIADNVKAELMFS